MRKKRKRWTIFLWGVACRGELVTSLRMGYTKSDIWTVAIGKSGSRSRQQAVARGWSVVRVRQTYSIVAA